MALIPCQYCGENISEYADVCPKCNNQTKQTSQNETTSTTGFTVVSRKTCILCHTKGIVYLKSYISVILSLLGWLLVLYAILGTSYEYFFRNMAVYSSSDTWIILGAIAIIWWFTRPRKVKCLNCKKTYRLPFFTM